MFLGQKVRRSEKYNNHGHSLHLTFVRPSDLERLILIKFVLMGPFAGVIAVPSDSLVHFPGEFLPALRKRWESVDPAVFGPRAGAMETSAAAAELDRIFLLFSNELIPHILGKKHPELRLDRPASYPLKLGVLDVAAKQQPLWTRVFFIGALRQLATFERSNHQACSGVAVSTICSKSAAVCGISRNFTCERSKFRR